MTRPFDVCVRGAGVVGQVLALLLARQRLRVALLAAPPAAAAAADVRAYALNAASRALLESLRAWPEAPAHCAVRGIEVHGDDGGRIGFDAPSGGHDDALAWIVDVPALEARLAQALQYQPLIEPVTEPVKAALTVLCDGRASAARDEFGVGFEAWPYPQRAIAARLRCEIPHQGIALQWFAGGEVLALLPLDGNSLALVWSVAEPRAHQLLALPDDEFERQLGAASGRRLGALRLDSARAAWPLLLGQASAWVGPGFALAGDAAHVVHPLAGQGLNLGLADAAELDRVLREREYWRGLGEERLLRRYERARVAELAALRWTTDGLHALFARDDARLRLLRNRGMDAVERLGGLKRWLTRQAAGRPVAQGRQAGPRG